MALTLTDRYLTMSVCVSVYSIMSSICVCISIEHRVSNGKVNKFTYVLSLYRLILVCAARANHNLIFSESQAILLQIDHANEYKIFIKHIGYILQLNSILWCAQNGLWYSNWVHILHAIFAPFNSSFFVFTQLQLYELKQLHFLLDA